MTLTTDPEPGRDHNHNPNPDPDPDPEQVETSLIEMFARDETNIIDTPEPGNPNPLP